MACSNCNTSNCGCSGTYTVSQTCPPACSEVFNTACIVYTGVDITCPDNTTGITSTVVSRNDYLDTALTKIINYFCGRFNNLVHPTTVVQPADAFVVVDETVSNSVTTYSVGLDIAAVAAAVDGSTTVVEAGGTNVTVDETIVGTVTTYTVTAQGTDVVSGDDFIGVQITQNGDDDIATITLDINEVEAALGTVSVAQGTSDHVVVTTVNNFPTTGDTQYRLDTISTDVVSTDPILTVVTTPGIAPLYDQVFTLDLDETLLAQLVMDTLNQTGGLGSIGLQEGTGIALNYDPATYTMVISSTVTDPVRWLSLIDDFGAFLDPSLGTSTLAFLGDGGLVSGGFDGISATLNANPAAAELQLINTDPGSGQLIFGTVAVLGEADILALTNTDTLTFVAGANIGLTTDAGTQSLTIVNEIDHVYSDVIADSGGSLQAATTTATLELLGGTGISTVGAAGPTNSVTINNDGVTSIIAGTDIAITSTGPGGTGAVTVNSTASTNGNQIQVAQDITVAGGIVTSPVAGAINRSADISSLFMQCTLIDNATSKVIPIDSSTIEITQNVGAGLLTATSTVNGSYTLIITGDAV